MSTTRRRDRKELIVAAAAELFAQKGYAAVGIDDIGAAVGISGPGIYRHFSGKNALLLAVLESSAAHVADAMTAAAQQEHFATPEGLIAAAVSATFDLPAALLTAVRERHRLLHRVGSAAELAKFERRTSGYWRGAIRSLNPGLGTVAERTRLAAVAGIAVPVARGLADVARPRLDELGASSCLAILRAPQAAPTPEPPHARWRPAATRRDEILSAAVTLFGAHGFHGVGVDEIGEAAGISGPTLYHYYDNKADILVDAFGDASQRIAAGIESAFASATSAADALERLVRGYANVALDHDDLLGVALREADALPDHDVPRLLRFERICEDRWTAVLREVRPELPEADAKLLVRSVFPVVLLAVRGAMRRPDRLDDIAAVALAHLNS